MTRLETLRQLLGTENVLENEPMSRHTSFQVGGPADLFLTPTSVDQIKKTLQLLREAAIPVYVMGNGSNLLVLDGGIRGAVVQLGRPFSRIRIVEQWIYAQAGTSLAVLAAAAADAGLTGLEFAAGIPGALGGALTMNAGAYDGEMSQVVARVLALTSDGESRTLENADLEFGYRTSRLATENLTALTACLCLEHGDEEEIRKKMRIWNHKRRESQPLEYPSAGSTFKRPEGHFAGKLIQDAGLKGYRLGGAQVSEKHAGFIINANGASAADIVSLMEYCQRVVYDQTGVWLEPEVKLWGEPLSK